MELLMEFIVEIIFGVIFEGSYAVLKSKKTSWITKAICSLVWIGVFGGLFFVGICTVLYSNKAIGFLILAFGIFLVSMFIYGLFKGEEIDW